MCVILNNEAKVVLSAGISESLVSQVIFRIKREC